jgi:hypothetical protein
MADLTLRQTKGSPLTIDEMDGNFEYFTGSYTNTGIITAQGFSGSFTGSLQGTAQTASYVTLAQTASFITGSVFTNTNPALSASFAVSASRAISSSFATTSSFVQTAQTASYVLNTISSSFASTASFVQNAQTASYVQNTISSSFAQTASYVQNTISSSFAQTASYVQNTISSSFAQTASYVQNAQTASYVQNAQTASYVQNAVSSSFASTASFVRTAQTASYVLNAVSASYATVAQTVLNASLFALVGSPNTFISNQTIQGYLTLQGSLNQGTGVTNGNASHAQGNTTTAGYYGYYSGTTGVTAGVFELEAAYGDLTSIFTSSSFALFDDPSGLINGTPSVIKSQVSSSIYITGGIYDYTEVTLFDTTIDSISTGLVVGIFGTPQPAGANYSIGNYSHAEGESTTTIGLASHAEGYGTLAQGYYSHAEGNNTIAQGNYQHVQGQFNQSSSAQSAFIVGNGTSNSSRSNLIFASGSQVQITGSLTVSGSGTFINIGPAIFSGSITSTSGFTGSLQGTVTTASYATTSSYAATASLLLGSVTSASYAATASYATVAQTLLGSVTSASYAATSSLSNETIGAGDTGNTNGGEIQFRGSFGPGSPNGKTTYSSAFIWDGAYNGLLIADPNTTFTQNGGYYYLQVGTDVISAGNYSVSFGSSSYAQGEGSFTHGKAITANGEYSHAEGLGTIASGSYQHVQGRFNTQGDSTSLMIVGNGTADGSRKDAFKVRISGSIVLPTTQSAAPSWTGTDGEIIPATVEGKYLLYMWMSGAWRSGSFV